MLYLYIQGALLERRPPYLGSLGLCETICLYLVFLLSTQSYCCSLQVHLFFYVILLLRASLCLRKLNLTWINALPRLRRVAQSSQVKLCVELKKCFQQSFVEGLLFLTKAAGVFEGLRAPCLVNSADVANYSGSRRLFI